MLVLRRVALALGVTASLMLLPLSASDASEPDPFVVTGRVIDGGRAAPGAEVVVRAWPGATRLSSLRAGQRVELTILGRAEADAHGSYRLSVDPELLRTYRSPDGAVDLEVLASYDGRGDRWAFTSTSATGRAVRDFDLSSARAAATASASVDLCVMEAGDWLYNNRERFLMVHNWAGAKATVEQAIRGDATHTLGLGLKIGKGPWEARGTRTMTWSESSEAGVSVSGIVNKSIYNAVNYRVFVCRGWESGKVLERYVRPMSFYDLLSEPHTDLTHMRLRKSCVRRSKGELWKKTGTNQTYNNGVDLPFLDLSAQSGYDVGTRVGFTIKRPTWVCSNSDEGWVTASRIELHSAVRPPAGVA